MQEDETYEQGKTQAYFRLPCAQLDYLQLYENLQSRIKKVTD